MTGFLKGVVLAGLLLIIAGSDALAQETPAEPEVQAFENEQDDLYIVRPGEIPEYDALRFRDGVETELGDQFLRSLPIFDDDVITTYVVFPDVDPMLPYAELTLPELVLLALEGNFQLQNSERGVRVARSQTRSAEAPFIPFLDLVGDTRFTKTRDWSATRTVIDPNAEDPESAVRTVNTIREDSTWVTRGGLESGVTLPTAGQVTLSGTQTRTGTRVSDGGGAQSSSVYSNEAEIRYVQPLLRGGPEVGTAQLRRARISEMNQILGHNLTERDVVFSIINTYFQILQSARQLQVSSDAIQRRLAVMEEARIKFEVGRDDESQILTAEIQYLSQLETAIGQRRQLEEQRENMLILLGLPLDTPISFVDITDTLAGQGRVDIPDVELAIAEGLSNRLELMREDLSVTLARIDYGTARNDVLPDLGVSGGYRVRDSANDYGDAFDFPVATWDVGANLRVPLVNNISRREGFRRAGYSLETAETNRLQRERELMREVLQAHRNVLATEAQLTVVRKNVEQARRALDLITGRFEVGFATSTEVRLAQDDLFAAESRYNNALLNYQIQLARLYVALGRPLF